LHCSLARRRRLISILLFRQTLDYLRADTARYSHAFSWSGPLHYINIHDDAIAGGCIVKNRTTTTATATSLPEDSSYACQFDYARDCANDWCAAGAIVNYTSQLTPSGVTPKVVGGVDIDIDIESDVFGAFCG
jgi:hypothetical protein